MKRGTFVQKLCVWCHQHRAVFHYRGRCRGDHQHDLCPRCYRSAMDRLAAMILLTNLERQQ